jgi:hypothetical protein
VTDHPAAPPAGTLLRPYSTLNTSARLSRLIVLSSAESLCLHIICSSTLAQVLFDNGAGQRFAFSSAEHVISPTERPISNRAAKSTIRTGSPCRQVHHSHPQPCRQVHHCPCPNPALHPEVFREAMRGRSRRGNGSRKTRNRLCQGTALARLRPRAPAHAHARRLVPRRSKGGQRAGARVLGKPSRRVRSRTLPRPHRGMAAERNTARPITRAPLAPLSVCISFTFQIPGFPDSVKSCHLTVR